LTERAARIDSAHHQEDSMQNCRFRLSLAVSLAALVASTSVEAAIWYVDGTKATNGTGGSWGNAFNNLQSALNNGALASNDEIWVRGSSTGITYKPGNTRTDTFALKSRVKIYGGFAGTETELFERDPVANLTILSGEIGNLNSTLDNCHHVVSAIGPLQFPDTILDGFTITGGNTFDRSENPPDDFSGGGILIKVLADGEGNACRPIIARCVIKDNFSDLQGGGAAVVAVGLASPVCEPWFVNCEFRGNEASRYGGGLVAAGGEPILVNSIFTNNEAGFDGGGGAAVGFQASVTAINCTFYGNHASFATGGLAAVSNGNLVATNSIFWGNTDNSLTAPEQISYAEGNYCCIEDLPSDFGGVGNIDLDPLFVNAAAGNFRLALTSPCIDAGLSAALPPDVANIDADTGSSALSEPTPLDFGLVRRVSYADSISTDPCAPDVVDMGAHENGDCDGDLIRDENEVDTNGDGIPDECQDCNANSVLDLLELEGNDCNENDRLDACDIALGCSLDQNENGVPDECECAIDVVFVVDASSSIAGGGTDAQELVPICDMIAAVEAALPPSPTTAVFRIAVFGSIGLECLTNDVEGATGQNDEDSATCLGTIDQEDWISAVEVVSTYFPWRPNAIRVIVPISDEGACLAPSCVATDPPIVAAIAAANANSCVVFPIVGAFPDGCAPVAMNAIATGTGGATWAAVTVDDYEGIGEQLAERVLERHEECLLLTTPPQCPADLDDDGDVGASDLAILLGAWGPCSGTCPADLDDDGDVGASDLAILLGAWGPCDGLLMFMMSGTSEGIWEGSMTPTMLAESLGFGGVAELADYLSSLDFETMSALLEAFLGS
jgi:hypothetical protein